MRNKSCTDCPLHEGAHHVCMWGKGPKNAKVMVIGEAPGKNEDLKGAPFVGKAGHVLNLLLSDAGVNRDELYITNAVRCRPPMNQTPTRKELLTCRKYLIEEIKEVNPEYIFCLGKSAISSLTRNFRIPLTQARVGKWRINGSHVRATYHPAAILRTPYLYKVASEDFGRFFHGEEPAQKTAQRYAIVPYTQMEDTLRRYASEGRAALDIETNQLSPFEVAPKIWTLALSNEKGSGHVFVIYHREKPNPDPQSTLKLIEKYIVGNPEFKVIGHNVKFDLLWLKSFGLNIRCKMFDTMVAYHLLDENYPNKSLKHLARLFTDMGDYAKAIKEKQRNKKEYPDMHFPLLEMAEYNGRDADATYRLYVNFHKRLEEENLLKVMSFNMEILRTLIVMEHNGIKVDQDILHELTQEYEGKRKELEAKIRRDLPDLNLDSNQQLAVALYKTLRYPIYKRTPKGSPSVDTEALQLLAKQNCRVAGLLVERRKVMKLLNTYIHGKAAKIQEDGLIHTTFHLSSNREGGERGDKGGTVTGRLGSDMQQIPKVGGIKRMFVSRFEDGLICQADYSQIELRVLAHVSQDKTMVALFQDPNADVHRAVAAKVFRKPESEVTPLERSKCKAISFGVVYGIGPAHLAEEIGSSVVYAKRFLREWYDQFPQTESYLRNEERNIQKVGITTTLFGRRRRLIGGTKATAVGREVLRQGVNSPIQGSAVELTLFSMCLLQRKIESMKLKSLILLNVHDSVVCDVPQNEKAQISKLIREIFENPPLKKYFNFELKVPLKIDIKFGRTWGETEAYEDT